MNGPALSTRPSPPRWRPTMTDWGRILSSAISANEHLLFALPSSKATIPLSARLRHPSMSALVTVRPQADRPVSTLNGPTGGDQIRRLMAQPPLPIADVPAETAGCWFAPPHADNPFHVVPLKYAVYCSWGIIGGVDGLLYPVRQLIGPAQTRLTTTSILPRVALEYGHVWCASSTRARATSRSTLGRLTWRRAWRK